MKPSSLTLADSTAFTGFAPADQKKSLPSEVVFNTGMTGYEQSLTDPSYSGQILVFTYPLIGNYGVGDKVNWESEKIHAAGVVVSEACETWSHLGNTMSLLEWLESQKIPVITGVDTRALTKHLRKSGTMGGIIGGQASDLKKFVFETKKVSIKEPIIYNQDKNKTVILVDCGTKSSILKSLLNLSIRVKRVPSDYDYTDEKYDGVVISNGPGDPADYQITADLAKLAMKNNKPIFGICLGSQLMGIAAGAKTYKLTFGHRGHNQPCISDDGKKCYITSQNHGYAIDEKTLPHDWKVNFRNLNDNSVEGVEHKTKPFFSVQFHPEANPGPTDTAWLFNKFYELIK